MSNLNKKMIVDTLKCINFYYSKHVQNMKVNQDLKSLNSNINIIIQKAVNDLKTYNNVNNKLDKSVFVEYLVSLAADNNIKINKSDYKTQHNYITIDESVFNSYIDLCQFIHKQGHDYKNDGLIFNLGQLLYSVTTYLISINTLKNMKVNSSYYQVVKTLVNDKPAAFWIKSYYKDLLCHDRVALYNDSNLNTIICSNEYCSTSIIDKNTESISAVIRNSGGIYNSYSMVFYVRDNNTNALQYKIAC